MKLIKTKENTPIIFEHSNFENTQILDLDELASISSHEYYYFKEIPKYFNSEYTNFYWEGQYDTLYFLPGLIFTHKYGNNVIVSLITRNNNNELESYVNQTYLDKTPSHKILINKFNKFYGVIHRKDNYCAYYTFKQYLVHLELSLEDYTEEAQLEASKNFLTYKKWQTV